jgi:hypothetical protein
VELYLHSSNTPLWRGAQLKDRDNFIFTFNIKMDLRETSCEDERWKKVAQNDIQWAFGFCCHMV